MVVCFLKSSRNAVVIAHVGGHTQRIAASFPYLLCRKADFFFRSADHGDFGATAIRRLMPLLAPATNATLPCSISALNVSAIFVVLVVAWLDRYKQRLY
jgi:hypothetical protein